MQKNKKRHYFAGISWLGMTLMCLNFMVVNISFAEDVCNERETFVGCALQQDCAWYPTKIDGEKCVSRANKDEDKYNWDAADCSSDNIEDLEALSKYKYTIKINGRDVVRESVSEASILSICQEIIPSGSGVPAESKMASHVCDFPGYLTNEGKRKCRNYYEWQADIDFEKCFQDVENNWQASLKNSQAQNRRNQGLDLCNYESNFYEGPVFSGPGLRGGAQLAQRDLSDSISKQRDIRTLLINWSQFAIEIALVLAVIAIIWAGIRYITDLGDGSGVEAAKKIILWTIVGILVILGSYAIVNTVISVQFNSDLTYNSIDTLIT